MEDIKKILLVDDDEDILFALSHRFKLDKFHVLTCSDATKTIMVVEEEKPHLIILDVMMPNISGLDLIKKLKRNDLTKKIPVIIYTAKPKMRDVFILEGAEDLIAKPFEYDELLNKVNNLIFKYWSIK
ncbi:MAG: response regulator [Pseudomonadota bacterium]